MELYGKEKYTAARHYFEKYLALGKNDLPSVESEYYLADCGLQLFHLDAEPKLNEFIRKYPEHPKTQQALLSLGNLTALATNMAEMVISILPASVVRFTLVVVVFILR